MHCIIAGGRDFTDYAIAEAALDRIFSRRKPDSIICGMQRGADMLGDRYAKERGIPVQEFPADWDRYGKAAGPIRNREMAAIATHLVAFWDGKSRGTKDMIAIAKARGLEIRVVPYTLGSRE